MFKESLSCKLPVTKSTFNPLTGNVGKLFVYYVVIQLITFLWQPVGGNKELQVSKQLPFTRIYQTDQIAGGTNGGLQ